MGSIVFASIGFFQLFILGFLAISAWKMFEKAGLPGWGILIPFYNLYLYFKLAGKSGASMLLLLIPIVNIFVMLHTHLQVARNFGKEDFFGFGLMFLPFVFVPILGLGDAEYQGSRRQYREEDLITEIGEDGEYVEKIEVDHRGQW